MRCEWCYAKETEYRGEMSLELAKELATLIHSCGIKKIILIGGEPTIWGPLLDFNKFCRGIGVETQIATNALKFANDAFWENYVKNPNDLVGISLKGCGELSYKKTTGIKDFDSIVTGLRRGIDFFHCGVSTVYSSLNPNELIDTARFSKELGAKYLDVGFCTPVPTQKGSDGDFLIPPEQIVSNVMSVYDDVNSIMEGKISFSMKLPLCLWPETFLDLLTSRNQISTLCQLRQKSGLIFGVSGEVIMCNNLFDFPVGKFGEDFSSVDELLDFLNSPLIAGYYDRLNNYPSKKCISCKRFSGCGGGCPMFWSYYNADEVIRGFA